MYREEAYLGRRGFGLRNYPFGDPANEKIDYSRVCCSVAHEMARSTIAFWVHPTYSLRHIAADIRAFEKVARAYMKD